MSKRRRLLQAGVLAAALAAGAGSASAADLDYGRVPTDRYSSAYEDPRYRELYGPGPGAYVDVPPPSPPVPYAAPAHPVPPGYVYRDGPSRYAADDWRYRNGCVPREEIKRRLVDEGWRDFQDLELRPGVAKLTARRPSGDLYDLKVDRCSGEILHSQLLGRGGYGPYADGRRYDRPYY